MEADIRRFLRELGTDYIDIVLLHAVMTGNWTKERAGAMEALSRAKEQGLIRAVGASFHSLAGLRAAATSPWLDVALVRMNHSGRNMDASPDVVRPLIQQMAAAGKGVYSMKVLSLGTLDPERAIPYTLGVPGVSAITIGMRSEEEIRQNIEIVAQWQRQHAGA